MAVIGKDGKDDAAILMGLRVLDLPPLGLRINPRLSYFKIEMSGVSGVDPQYIIETDRILQASEQGGQVDSYGSIDSDRCFVIVGSQSEEEVKKFMATLPIVQKGRVQASVNKLEV